MREVIFLVLLALLVISGEARPKDEVGVQPVSPNPALAASNSTEIKTSKTPRRFVAEGYGKRSVPDEGEADDEDPESEVEVGPPGGEIVVKERKEGNQDENEGGEDEARNEERDDEREATASAVETKTKISFSRDTRSPQNKDSAGEVGNDKSSEEATRDNTTVVIAIARQQRLGSPLRTSEGVAAENEKKPEIAGKEEPTDVTTDSEDTTSSKSKRSPQSKDGACEDDKDERSEVDTSDDSASTVPIARPARPGTQKAPTEGPTRKEGTSETEGKEKSERASTDDTTDSEEDTSSSRSKRHPQIRDSTDEVDDDKSSEEDTHELTPAVASSPIASPQRPVLRRPTEVVVEEARVTAGNDKQEDKDKDADEDTTGSSEETNTKVTSSRNKRSPQKNDGTDNGSKDAKNETTTAAPTITRTPRPAPRRTTEGGGVTGKSVTHERPTPTSASRIPTPTPASRIPTPTPASRIPTPTPASRIPTPTPASRVPTNTPIIRRPTPTHTTNGPSN